MRILMANTMDGAGGAAGIVRVLAEAVRADGGEAWTVVGIKLGDDPHVVPLPNPSHGPWQAAWGGLAAQAQKAMGRVPGAWRLRTACLRLARPRRLADWLRGYEERDFPMSHHLPDLAPRPPDLLHLHNLHGWYFDLRALPALSRRLPTLLTPHDSWLLTGHCAHSLECERWRNGCGACPSLHLYPQIARDGTAESWRRKRDAFSGARLAVATPSRWLMDRVEGSMLAPAVAEARVIPHGVDLERFRPGDQGAARRALDLPETGPLLLFAADGLRRNPWKDYAMLEAAVASLGARPGPDLTFVALGQAGPRRVFGRCAIVFVPYQSDPDVVVRYFQAADAYIHPARVDTFPTTVLEALACGLPVLATAVGGIPEQVRSLRLPGTAPGLDTVPEAKATGTLVAPGDAAGLADAVEALLADAARLGRMAETARRDAVARFGKRQFTRAYLDLYHDLGAAWHRDGTIGRDGRPPSPRQGREQ